MESKAVFFSWLNQGGGFIFFNVHPDLWWNDPIWLRTHIFKLGGSTANWQMIFVIFTHYTP